MEEKGIQVAQPKGKEKSYAAASGRGTAVDWRAFEEQMAALEGTQLCPQKGRKVGKVPRVPNPGARRAHREQLRLETLEEAEGG